MKNIKMLVVYVVVLLLYTTTTYAQAKAEPKKDTCDCPVKTQVSPSKTQEKVRSTQATKPQVVQPATTPITNTVHVEGDTTYIHNIITPPAQASENNWWPSLILVLLAIIVLGYFGYLAYLNFKKTDRNRDNNQNGDQKTQTQSTSVVTPPQSSPSQQNNGCIVHNYYNTNQVAHTGTTNNYNP